MPIIMGADPDMKRPSIAAIDAKTGKLLAVDCIKVKGKRTAHNGVVDCVAAMRGCFHNMHNVLDFEDIAAIVVEGQETAYTAVSGANPRSIMFLAAVAGAMLAEATPECKTILFPTPQKWKGSVPKQIHQARVLGKMDLEYTKVGKNPKTGYCHPPLNMADVFWATEQNKGDWKHIVDAIGLAQWARTFI